MRYVFLGLITTGMMTYAVIDCVQTEDSRVRLGLPHWFWVVVILVLPFAGAALWLIVSNIMRRRFDSGEGARPSRPRPTRPRGPVAPDDDPDFLFRLEQQQRRAAQQKKAEQDPGTADPKPDSPASPDPEPDAGTSDEPDDGKPETGSLDDRALDESLFDESLFGETDQRSGEDQFGAGHIGEDDTGRDVGEGQPDENRSGPDSDHR